MGANLSLGYYDQKLDEFDPDSTVYEEAAADREGVTVKEVRDVLALMLFRGDDIEKPMGLLSGGERARVRIAQLLLDKPNVFILDEPTNHLDIASREALEGALEDFPGTIFCVSHDRYFLDKVAKRLLVLDPPKVVDFEGGYSAWVHKKAGDERPAPRRIARWPRLRRRANPRGISKLERKRLLRRRMIRKRTIRTRGRLGG